MVTSGSRGGFIVADAQRLPKPCRRPWPHPARRQAGVARLGYPEGKGGRYSAKSHYFSVSERGTSNTKPCIDGS